jgi:hypothetical protein
VSFSYNLYYVKWRLKKEARPTGVSRAGKNAHAAGVGTSQFSESLPFIFGDQGTFSESKKLSGLSYLRRLRIFKNLYLSITSLMLTTLPFVKDNT